MSRPRLAPLLGGSATVLLTVLLVLLLSGTTSTAWIALTCGGALALGVAVAYALRPQPADLAVPPGPEPPAGGRATATSSAHR
jgi:hypothetical protein